ncbi:uncharacterized protein zgc:193726 isoform X3 [Puntigrus tetrazona]|uniref:uncharacterized protein zgc:193726 isoform X3 n=1 Tax=Puntigrus tetrazona TaxID=1606681 RepID=UPI001C8A60B4|nr:uncharacterized protein zgc:193726 isoform X3 [Puntigrus tetrazona]
MILVWTLTSLVLSYTLGFPVLNNTSGSHMETLINATIGNFTVYNATKEQRSPFILPGTRGIGCALATCATENLVDRMQTGDEKAGDRANDALGPGKK